MTSESHSTSCLDDPNFATICSFLEKFGELCHLVPIPFAQLQEMLENTNEVPVPLVQLHIRLLRRVFKSINTGKWEKSVSKFAHMYNSQDGWEVERFGYKKSKMQTKLRILKNLLESQFDFNVKFKGEVNKLPASDLRMVPLGRDQEGHSYWYQVDAEANLRVYREDVDEETWEIVASSRDEMEQLITQLQNGEIRKKSIDDNIIEEEINGLESMDIEPKEIILDTGKPSELDDAADGDSNDDKLEIAEGPPDINDNDDSFDEEMPEKEEVSESLQNIESPTPLAVCNGDESALAPKSSDDSVLTMSSSSVMSDSVVEPSVSNKSTALSVGVSDTSAIPPVDKNSASETGGEVSELKVPVQSEVPEEPSSISSVRSKRQKNSESAASAQQAYNLQPSTSVSSSSLSNLQKLNAMVDLFSSVNLPTKPKEEIKIDVEAPRSGRISTMADESPYFVSNVNAEPNVVQDLSGASGFPSCKTDSVSFDNKQFNKQPEQSVLLAASKTSVPKEGNMSEAHADSISHYFQADPVSGLDSAKLPLNQIKSGEFLYPSDKWKESTSATNPNPTLVSNTRDIHPGLIPKEEKRNLSQEAPFSAKTDTSLIPRAPTHVKGSRKGIPCKNVLSHTAKSLSSITAEMWKDKDKSGMHRVDDVKFLDEVPRAKQENPEIQSKRSIPENLSKNISVNQIMMEASQGGMGERKSQVEQIRPTGVDSKEPNTESVCRSSDKKKALEENSGSCNNLKLSFKNDPCRTSHGSTQLEDTAKYIENMQSGGQNIPKLSRSERMDIEVATLPRKSSKSPSDTPEDLSMSSKSPSKFEKRIPEPSTNVVAGLDAKSEELLMHHSGSSVVVEQVPMKASSSSLKPVAVNCAENVAEVNKILRAPTERSLESSIQYPEATESNLECAQPPVSSSETESALKLEELPTKSLEIHSDLEKFPVKPSESSSEPPEITMHPTQRRSETEQLQIKSSKSHSKPEELRTKSSENRFKREELSSKTDKRSECEEHSVKPETGSNLEELSVQHSQAASELEELPSTSSKNSSELADLFLKSSQTGCGVKLNESHSELRELPEVPSESRLEEQLHRKPRAVRSELQEIPMNPRGSCMESDDSPKHTESKTEIGELSLKSGESHIETEDFTRKPENNPELKEISGTPFKSCAGTEIAPLKPTESQTEPKNLAIQSSEVPMETDDASPDRVGSQTDLMNQTLKPSESPMETDDFLPKRAENDSKIKEIPMEPSGSLRESANDTPKSWESKLRLEQFSTSEDCNTGAIKASQIYGGQKDAALDVSKLLVPDSSIEQFASSVKVHRVSLSEVVPSPIDASVESSSIRLEEPSSKSDGEDFKPMETSSEVETFDSNQEIVQSEVKIQNVAMEESSDLLTTPVVPESSSKPPETQNSETDKLSEISSKPVTTSSSSVSSSLDCLAAAESVEPIPSVTISDSKTSLASVSPQVSSSKLNPDKGTEISSSDCQTVSSEPGNNLQQPCAGEAIATREGQSCSGEMSLPDCESNHPETLILQSTVTSNIATSAEPTIGSTELPDFVHGGSMITVANEPSGPVGNPAEDMTVSCMDTAAENISLTLRDREKFVSPLKFTGEIGCSYSALVSESTIDSIISSSPSEDVSKSKALPLGSAESMDNVLAQANLGEGSVSEPLIESHESERQLQAYETEAPVEVHGSEPCVNSSGTEPQVKAAGTDLQPEPAGSDLQPDAAGTDLQPDAAGTDLQPEAIGTDLQPEAIGADLQPEAAGTDLQPETTGTDLQPETTGTDLQPETTGTDLQPETTGTDLQPETTGTDLQPETTGTDLQPETTGTDLQPETTGTDLQPETTGTDLQPETTGADPHPEACETNQKHEASGTDLQPEIVGSDLQGEAVGIDLQPQASKTDLQPQASKTDLQPQASKTDLQPQASGTDLQHQACGTESQIKEACGGLCKKNSSLIQFKSKKLESIDEINPQLKLTKDLATSEKIVASEERLQSEYLGEKDAMSENNVSESTAGDSVVSRKTVESVLTEEPIIANQIGHQSPQPLPEGISGPANAAPINVDVSPEVELKPKTELMDVDAIKKEISSVVPNETETMPTTSLTDTVKEFVKLEPDSVKIEAESMCQLVRSVDTSVLKATPTAKKCLQPKLGLVAYGSSSEDENDENTDGVNEDNFVRSKESQLFEDATSGHKRKLEKGNESEQEAKMPKMSIVENPIVGEAIEEDLMIITGTGEGAQNEGGNESPSDSPLPPDLEEDMEMDHEQNSQDGILPPKPKGRGRPRKNPPKEVLKDKNKNVREKTSEGKASRRSSFNTDDVNGTNASGPVRRSGRVAQIRQKEEEERRKLEEERLAQLKEAQVRKQQKLMEKELKTGVKPGEPKVAKKPKGTKTQKHVSYIPSPSESGSDSDNEPDEEYVDRNEKQGKKRRKKRSKNGKPIKRGGNPWMHSSSEEDEAVEEEEEEHVEEEEEEELIFNGSDHEFSPESDIGEESEYSPSRHARTAKQKEEAVDKYAETYCDKCGKGDHPEWILLCDSCDKGWHALCVNPQIWVIPEGEWFCPPCQHKMLVSKLSENLVEYEKLLKKRENEVLRKQRLAYVGISLNNVLPSAEKPAAEKSDGENGEEKKPKKSSRRRRLYSDEEEDIEDFIDDNEDGDENRSGSGSGSYESEEEPIYQLRARRATKGFSFQEYDDMIKSALRGDSPDEDEKEKVDEIPVEKSDNGLPPETKEEKKVKDTEGSDDEDDEDDKIGVVKKKPVIKDDDTDEDELDEKEKNRRKMLNQNQKKSRRRLNDLDATSEEDSDEDFKGSGIDDDEEDEENVVEEDSDWSEDGDESDDSIGVAKLAARKRKRHGPLGRQERYSDVGTVRRSTRRRKSRITYDESDQEEDEEDQTEKWQSGESENSESESEDEDETWGKKKKKKIQATGKSKLPNFFLQGPGSFKKNKPKKKRRRTDEDDVDRAWSNKFGNKGRRSDEPVERKTRGRQINFKDILDSGESDDDGNIRPKRRRILSDSDEDSEEPSSSRKLAEEIRAANAKQMAEEKLQHEEKLKALASAEKQLQTTGSAATAAVPIPPTLPPPPVIAAVTVPAIVSSSELLPPFNSVEISKDRPIKITNSIVESILLRKSPDIPDSPPSPLPLNITSPNDPIMAVPPLSGLSVSPYLPSVIPPMTPSAVTTAIGLARVGKKKTAAMLPTPASSSDVLPFPSKKLNTVLSTAPLPPKPVAPGITTTSSVSANISSVLPPGLATDLTRIAGPLYGNNPALRSFHPAWGRNPPPYSGPPPPAGLGKPPPLNSSSFMAQPGQLRPPPSSAYSQQPPPGLRIPNPNALQAFQQFSKRTGEAGAAQYRLPPPHQLPSLPSMARERDRIFVGGSSPYATYGILPPQGQGQQHAALFAPPFEYRAPETFKEELLERAVGQPPPSTVPVTAAAPSVSVPGSGSKEEGGSQGDGEFGGLVSYFSSQHSNDED